MAGARADKVEEVIR